ncbi:protein kinase domain-containing protein [Amycolatopsis pigmentata]|uniref:Protein kinase n=1 Tax=Amycolatopsis pigmentata TaxID=450801 RepID=A0ABW5FQF8_9PSEU
MGIARRRPVDPAAPPALRDLVCELRRMADTKFESLRALEKAAHVGRSTLSDALSGRRLPTVDVVLAIVRACGQDEDEWRERWHATRVSLLASGDHGEESAVRLERVAEPVLAPLQDGDPRRAGPFRLQGVLGTGAMGRVYLAHTPGKQAVAVKVLRGEFADDVEFRRRFRREVDAARAVHGLFTAPVIDADPDAARPWLATAYVAGPSLRETVTTHGPLPVEAVVRIAAAVAEGLRAVHAAGIVHRDLNPGNVLLAADGPKVIDFGIARAADASHLTRTGAPVGTAAFMAPEQATGGEVGPASDVFSLGALLTYAATGKPPFGEGPAETSLYRVVHAEPDLDGIDDESLRALIGDCLAKDPEQRPAPAELVARLDPTATLPQGWPPPAVAAELARHLPPHPPRLTRRRVAMAAAVVVAAVVATAGVLTETTGGTHQAGGHPAPPDAAGGTPPSATTTPASATAPGPAPTAPPGGALPSPQTGAPPDGHGDAQGNGGSAPGPGGGDGGGSGDGVGAASVPSARVSFEDGDDDWSAFYGGDKLSHSVTTSVAYDGTHSLLLTAGSGSDACAIGTDRIPGLAPGSMVTLHLYYSGQGQGDVRPFVQDTGYHNHFQSPITLRGTGWTTVTFTVPAMAIHGIGFQIDNTGRGNLVLALDAVNW